MAQRRKVLLHLNCIVNSIFKVKVLVEDNLRQVFRIDHSVVFYIVEKRLLFAAKVVVPIVDKLLIMYEWSVTEIPFQAGHCEFPL